MAYVSIFGTTGLVSIPTAYILPDGRLAIGISYVDKHYGQYTYRPLDQIAYYATLAYLPFLEVSLRATQYPDLSWSENYTRAVDRQASVKLLLLKENRYIPSLVLGVHDLYGKSIQYNAQYIVISKTMIIPSNRPIGINLGYAPNPIKSDRIINYSMQGVFAGLQAWVFKPILSVMIEYDSQKYNAGLRITPVNDWICIDLVALGLKHVSGNISISFNL